MIRHCLQGGYNSPGWATSTIQGEIMSDKKKSSHGKKPVKVGGAGRPLRAAAEKKLALVPSRDQVLATEEFQTVLHELQVHQIELEMQNEELRRAHQATEESRDKYQDLYDFSPVGYFTLTPTGVIIEANLSVAKMLGIESPKLLGRGLGRFVSLEDLGRWDQHLFSVSRSVLRQTCDLRFRRGDGLTFYARLDSIRLKRPARDDNGDGRAEVIRIAVSDITHRKQAEESLRKSQEQYRTLVENISYGIVLIDSDRRIVMANAAHCRMFHKLPGELIGKCCYVEFEKRSHACPHCPGTQAMITGQPAEFKTEGIRDDGSRFYVRIQAFPIMGAGGHGESFIEVVEDITDKIRMEDQLRRTQKMEVVGQLAGGVAHDFRNQLTVIQGYGEMLLRHNMVTGKAMDYVKGILAATERSATTAGRLLAFARKEVLQPRVVNLSNEIAGLAKVLSGMIGEDIHLRIVRLNESCYASVDVGQFQQALLNLVLNARDAMPNGGELTLETNCVELDAQAVRGNPDAKPGRYAMVAVTDVGTGMSQADMEHVFEPFYTTKQVGKGTGLGLPMVQGFVGQSGGFVKVDSTPGKGSTFSIYFPYVDEKPQRVASEVDKKTVSGGTETILVVEDEEPLRTLLVQQLEELNYNVLQADNFKSALSQLEKHPGKIDLLLTDIVMPGGSGIELARHVRETRADIRVMFLSGYGAGELARRGVLESRTNFLSKPFTGLQLAESIRSALAGTDVKDATPSG
jgi:two-component system cell cycle sensor histidine kinase/response regulator CckA